MNHESDSMYSAVLRKDCATVEIPFGYAALDPETNFTPEELEIVARLVPKLRDRNFTLAVPGWKFNGYVKVAEFDVTDDKVLRLTIQLQELRRLMNSPGVHCCSACHAEGVETMVYQCRCPCDRTPKYDTLCTKHKKMGYLPPLAKVSKS